MSDSLAHLTKPVPRYTSYPTAPHFHAGIDQRTYEAWLAELAPDARVSLYLHLPFCDRLCWFCGCHTKQINRYAPVTQYLEALKAEIVRIAGIVGNRPVTAIHWGGGSPSLLAADDIAQVTALLRSVFNVTPSAEFSVELDPSDMEDAKFDAWAAAGLTRASIGVQDFDPKVQVAINRLQSFEQTKVVVDAMRSRGVGSVNIDMLYGLPHQTIEGAASTARQVVSLRPDRVALFGYAHVPWIKKHQTMIEEASLPDSQARFAQANAAADVLRAAGYVSIGFDHFALPHDSMAKSAVDGTLQRNFQGYTVDEHDALIGLGASAIGRLPQGYIQNVVATGDYQRRALSGEGTVAKGIALTDDDRLRGYAIERLMCDFQVDFNALRQRFGGAAEPVICEAVAMAMEDQNGHITMRPGVMEVTAAGRPFVRSYAARFDAYLAQDTARYSKAV
ncbi:oxygen-independent coproporphyrinogen III oxidase [Devosia aquimaris]|uniref:oxygen-independent coproporphyrinogen III oxidase n=1 Tax=Devosia aquimaris TaxID=2866214 RepID=UPI001CD0AFD9|nr:oxygen-independent coproporphyrinogen III oxidase [Devosia sp. CJK-A8-3]